ncbi:MAG TPA: LPS export ABC transporter permease LptF, partial [Xanthomonadales bacterium]|nr:LPS export ABC transporter permease LptF [Xanthomonadales bacterium]
SQIGLRAIDGLTLLLPLGLFIAVLLAYGRLYRDSEMAVLSASGFSNRGLLKPLAWLAVPITLALGLISFWIGPAAMRLADQLIDQANRSLLIAGMEAGRFVELPGREGVVYVAEMEPDGSRFRRLFVHDERENRVDIVTAEAGELFQDRDGGERYLALSRGFRVEGEVGKPSFRTMRFERNDIRLPELGEDATRRREARASPIDLLESSEPADRAELHWRLGLPLSAFVLALLALPLSQGQPREPRYGKALVAVLAFALYTNLLALGRAWLADGTIPIGLGLWWVHGLALALAAALIAKGARISAPRSAAA